MSKKDQIQELLNLTSQEVANLGNAQRNNVFRVLKQAEEELAVGLRKWLDEVPDGAERYTGRHLRAALLHTRTAINTLSLTRNELKSNLFAGHKEAVSLAIQHTEREFYYFREVFGEAFKPLNIDLVGLIANDHSLLLKKFRKAANKYTTDIQSHIKKNLAVGIIKGETIDQMVKRLMRNTDSMAKGLMKLPKASAHRLIRTELMYAYNTHHHRAIDTLATEHDDVMKRWDSTLDRRGCLTCRDLEGEVVGTKENFSTGIPYPPQHPHCRCTVVAWSKDWET